MATITLKAQSEDYLYSQLEDCLEAGWLPVGEPKVNDKGLFTLELGISQEELIKNL